MHDPGGEGAAATIDPEPLAPMSGTGRSLGLDVFRGLVIAWLLVLVHVPTTGWRGHAAWFGWGNSDVFFPAFLFVAGAGLGFQTRWKPMPWARLVRRFVTLVVLGLFVNAWTAGGADLTMLRIPGVLQRIALVGLAGAAVAVAVRRRWQAALVVALALALAWAVALQVSARDCVDGLPQPDGCGTLLAVDTAVFGEQHVYHQGRLGHDPEGLASTVGALATFVVGYGAAMLVQSLRARTVSIRAGALLAVAAGWLVVLPLLLWFQPVAKRLWTGSFVAVNAAWCLALLAAVVFAFDRDRHRAVELLTWPLVALGRNALVIWTAIFLQQPVLARTTVDGRRLGEWFVAEHGAAAYLAVFGGGWLVIAMLMHAARWHVRL